MKKRTLLLLSVLFPFNLFSVEVNYCPDGWLCPAIPFLKSEMQIGAWYSIYFYERGSKPVDHWSQSRYKPELGYYSSGDVVQAQYSKMKDVGINYILLDHTNGIGNDGGAINENAEKVFRDMPLDIPIAIANGAPLWISYDGNGQYKSRDKRINDQKAEADFIYSQFAQRSNYLKWYDSKSNMTKPLLVVYNDIQNEYPTDDIVRYWEDSRYSVRYAGGYIDSANPLLIPYAERGGLWGWATKTPQLPSFETMVVQPGWSTEHIPGRDGKYASIKRKDGAAYMEQWLEIIKHKPANVIIASWNDWCEETSIEPAVAIDSKAEPFKDYYGEETPDWYLQITKAYSNLKTGLMPLSYYKTKNDPRVFQVVNGQLILQNKMPRKAPVILLPEGGLDEFLYSKLPIPSGLFMVGVGIYQSNVESYCQFQSMVDFTSLTGKTNAEGIVRYDSIPSSMKNLGSCKKNVSTTIPAGLFMVGVGIYQSNVETFCQFQSMVDFTSLTGKTNAEGIVRYDSIPSSMKNLGSCKKNDSTTIPAGLFMVGVGIYKSNVDSYCQFQSMFEFTSITGKTNADGIKRYDSIPKSMRSEGQCR